MSDITEEAQNLSPDTLIELFELDASAIGGSVYHFTSDNVDGQSQISFGGTVYTAVPIEAEGFEWNGQGAPPIPKLRTGNVNRVLQAATRTLNGLIGAQVTRTRTFRKFLDDGSASDSTQVFNRDFYRVERMANRTASVVEFELAAAVDQEGRTLPGRVALRDYCDFIYRRYDPDTGTFDYSRATCPYVGSADTGDDSRYFDENGVETSNPAEDRCSKKLETGCKPRFDQNRAEGFQKGVLPFRGFPGMQQVR
jgi:lambda family phage minor tail protein L